MEMKIVFPGGQKVNALCQNFTIKTDQPADKKGDNSAPTPFELFWASLGTCMGYYILAFCRQRNLPTQNIELQMKMDRDPKTKMVGSVNVEIKLPPEIPEKYHKAIIKSADACFVKKHLFNPPQFEIYTTQPQNQSPT